MVGTCPGHVLDMSWKAPDGYVPRERLRILADGAVGRHAYHFSLPSKDATCHSIDGPVGRRARVSNLEDSSPLGKGGA